MKKSCEGCKALNGVNLLSDWQCELDYKIDGFKGIPLEKCPKPKTYQKLLDLKELKQKYNLTNEELTKWKFL